MPEIVDIGALGVYSQMAGYGFCDAAGTAVPANNTRGYAHGCIYRRLNGVDADDAVYINRGNQNQSNFDALVTGGNSGVDLIAETITEATTGVGVFIDSFRLYDGELSTAGTMVLESGGAGFQFRLGDESYLSFNDTAQGFTASEGIAAADIFMESAGGGVALADTVGPAGANFTFTAGAGSEGGAHDVANPDGGASGCISFVTVEGGAAGSGGSGAAGNAGVIRLISAPGVVFFKQGVTTKTTTASLTAAEVLTGLLSTTGTSYTVTLPTATELDTAIHSQVGANEAFDFRIVNTASGTVTLAVGAGSYTAVGALTVATNTSAGFRIVRTAANAFTVYRI